MTDIVGRLRSVTWPDRADSDIADTCKKAANEIERLHSLNTELVAALEKIATGIMPNNSEDRTCVLQMRGIAGAALAKVKEGK